MRSYSCQMQTNRMGEQNKHVLPQRHFVLEFRESPKHWRLLKKGMNGRGTEAKGCKGETRTETQTLQHRPKAQHQGSLT